MEPDPLEREDARRLSSADWVALHRYLAREGAPLRKTAEVMRELGKKLEQEALLDEVEQDRSETSTSLT